MRITRIFCALLLFALSAPGYAASFDCARAASPVEKTICGNSDLSRADESLSKAYADALAASLDGDHIRLEQRKWLKDRQKYSSAADLLNSYKTRMASLNDTVEQWRQVPRDITAESLRTTCLASPGAPTDRPCTTSDFGPIPDSQDLYSQTQSWSGGDAGRTEGVAVLREIAGHPGHYAPVILHLVDGGTIGGASIIHAGSKSGPRLLQIDGQYEGTGMIDAGALYLFGKDGLESVDLEAWQTELSRKLPKGMTVDKGIYPDYAAMTAETPVWAASDPACCPTGGRAYIKLELVGHRLAVKSVQMDRGEAAARPAAEPDNAARDCGRLPSLSIDADSFEPTRASDPKAYDTAAATPIGDLIRDTLEALCAEHKLSPKEVGARLQHIVVSYGGGADSFNTYFATPSDQNAPGTLIAEWAWSGEAVPTRDDVRAGILCGFRPQEKVCAARAP